jgi:copper chaperone
MEKAMLQVDGMSCEHCVKAVNKAIGTLAGVRDVVVDLKKGTVAFQYDPALTALAVIKAAIDEQGYEVR